MCCSDDAEAEIVHQLKWNRTLG